MCFPMPTAQDSMLPIVRFAFWLQGFARRQETWKPQGTRTKNQSEALVKGSVLAKVRTANPNPKP